jgi:hypothetical protein
MTKNTVQERGQASKTESKQGMVLTWKRRGGSGGRRRAQGVAQSQQMLETGDDGSRISGHASLRRWWGKGGIEARRAVDGLIHLRGWWTKSHPRLSRSFFTQDSTFNKRRCAKLKM